MLRATVAVSLLLCSLTSASLRGASDKGRSLGISIDLPGVSINVPSNGSPSISIGGNSTDGGPIISIGNDSITIGGQTFGWGSNSTSNMTCDNLPSTSLSDEPSCETALTSYYEKTTDAKFTRARSEDQKKVLDDFCDTRCGQVFTARTVATRLGCTSRQNESDVDSGVLTPQNITLGDGVVVDIPSIFNISVPKRTRKGDDSTTTNKALADDLKPDFSPEFPGLWLGCIKDTETNDYCALKRADPDADECGFYKSCCYAELNAITDISLSSAAKIEAKCPGATVYRLGTLCTA